jgi:acyl-CoA reductase-like NAD-dependent aldehyde dehydrogenase
MGSPLGVWTRDISRAHRLARALRARTVWINCYNQIEVTSPFGGYKQSGFGRELGLHSLELYTQIKSVWLRL